jgi:hypothetical protein
MAEARGKEKQARQRRLQTDVAHKMRYASGEIAAGRGASEDEPFG